MRVYDILIKGFASRLFCSVALLSFTLFFIAYFDLLRILTHFLNSISVSFLFYVFLIFIGFVFLQYFGLYGTFFISLLGVTVFWWSLCKHFYSVFFENLNMHIVIFKWFALGNSCVVDFEFLIDQISFSFAFLTTTIAVFVNIYAFSYFRYEPNVDRLVLFLNAFVISMVVLVLSGNLVMLFLGWELIGLTSFLLINFWATRSGTFKSAFKAYAFNKYSDFLLFAGLLLVNLFFQTLNISDLLESSLRGSYSFFAGFLTLNICDLVSFCFLGAAFIKSAQIGGHIWLPDSMEAPVPASALIHSATLVSAGVFLILRLYPIFEQSTIFYAVTPFIGVFTAFYGGIVAFYQNDLKRILAYSTISHCGFLIFLTTLGSVEFCLLYLYVHGFFKAIAFLCVGNVIRFSKNYQDVRRMGQYWKYLPFEFSIIFLSLMNLSGLPFFFGFCIKHLVFIAQDSAGLLCITGAILFLAALTGTFYFYKVIFYTFFDIKKGRKSIYFSNARMSTASRFYSNSTIASLVSIFLLSICAYYIIYVLFFNLVLSKAAFLQFHELFYKNTAYYLFDFDLMALFNYSFLNWVVLVCLIFLLYFRWSSINFLACYIEYFYTLCCISLFAILYLLY